MLGKLIKHEFRATGRVMLPMLAALAAISLLAGPIMELITRNVNARFVRSVSTLLIVATAALMFAVCIAAFVLMIQRFYKSLFTDEGYISMTLPVSPEAHIFAKLVVSTVWFAADCIICILALLTLSGSNTDIGLFNSLFDVINDIAEYIGAGNIVLYAFEALLAATLVSFVSCLRFYLAISAGCSFSDHKILLSVVFYFVIGAVIDALQITAAVNVLKSDIISDVYFDLFAIDETIESFIAASHGLIWAGVLYMLILGAIYYIPTAVLMKKKLNLA